MFQADIVWTLPIYIYIGFPGGATDKRIPLPMQENKRSASVPGSGRFPGGGHGNPLQYS